MKSFLAATALLAASAIATPLKGRGASPKRGASFNTVATTNTLADSISWAYDWSPTKDGNLPQGVDFVPMLWGTDPNHLNGWEAAADAAIAGGASHLLGFNEPDLPAQANLSPQAAADAWKQHIQPYAGRAKLVSPAITNGPPPMGTGWMDQFLAACNGCTIDAIAIHIYSPVNEQYFQDYIGQIAAKYQKPIWITEFQGQQPGDEVAFINQLVPWLDSEPSVERYAYFAAIEGQLIQGGNLTPAGQAYKNAA